MTADDTIVTCTCGKPHRYDTDPHEWKPTMTRPTYQRPRITPPRGQPMTHYDKTPIAAVIVTCGAKASTPVKVGPPIRWRCGRNAGHEGPHQALGFEGRVVKEWPR